MPPHLKSEAPEEFKLAIQRLEDCSDDWFQSCSLAKRPWNVAFWGTLTAIVDVIERAIRERGNASADHKAAMLNLGLIGPMVLNEIQKSPVPANSTGPLRINTILASEALQAVDAGHKRLTFMYTFPIWHRDQYYAELIGPQRIRFKARGDVNDRRVSAYQKGFRAGDAIDQREHPQDLVPATEIEMNWILEAYQSCRPNGPLGFFYPRPFLLMQSLCKKYSDLLLTQFRRDLNLSLGAYRLGDFAAFYPALLAVCSVHEQLCHLWSLEHPYPLDSAVLVKSRASWIKSCQEFSSLQPAAIDQIIQDLTFGTIRPLALQVHPFVSLNENQTLLALIPHFPLGSKPDENILRVCSYIRRAVFDAASLTKEDEARKQLTSQLPPNFSWTGPINLPRPAPDIDLLISDTKSSLLLICELKWIRKPTFAMEHADRDKDFFKGVVQLKQIEKFLNDNPSYLKERGIVAQNIKEIRGIYYVLVARDHFKWIDPQDGIILVDYDVFKEGLRKATSLQDLSRQLMTFSWLPEQGRDFVVRTEYAISNGVVIDSENFYSPMGAAAPWSILPI